MSTQTPESVEASSATSRSVIDQSAIHSLSRWLWIVYGMIFCMVVIGGITRLTGSGLSMVEWRPLMGSLPPLTEGEWQRVFDLYQQSPQYQLVNDWMKLDDFKLIFFWEYLHRLFGRLIGIVFALPWLYFIIKGVLRGAWLKRATAALIFGGSQGLLGWYMVKSGLVDQPQVSHLRLAAHLSLAFFCGQWVWLMLLDLNKDRIESLPSLKKNIEDSGAERSPPKRTHALAFFLLLILQIVYGAFMAGSKAGYLYATYPTMNGRWIAPTWFDPAGAFRLPELAELINAPDSIHFIHRALAVIVLGYGLWLGLRASRVVIGPVSRYGAYLLIALSLQFVLGVLTIISGMNISLAAAHQGGAFILLSVTVALLWSLSLPFKSSAKGEMQK